MRRIAQDQSGKRLHLAAPGVFACVAILLTCPSSVAQGGPPGKGGPPPATVRYTVAREIDLKRTLTLPGSVEAQTWSTVASSVAGQVIEFTGREGLRVKAGDVLARLRTTTLELHLASQKASLAEAEARQKLAESNLARAKELFAGGVASRQQLDDAQSEYNAWSGRTDSLKAEIARIRDDIEQATIRAPFSGVVARERTESGQWLAVGAPVVDLMLIDQLEIRVDAPERFFAGLRAGAAATATFESLPGVTAQGRVIAVIPQADPQARTFPVKVLISNERGRIGAGMLAQVIFSAGESYRATMVPKDAVISRGQRRILYRVNGTGTVDEVAIETGAGSRQWVEVRGGVKPGDRVITRGNERIFAGQPVHATLLEYDRP